MPKLSILLVEDDEVDIKIYKRTFEKQELNCIFNVAENGVDALEKLRKLDPIDLPQVMLVDINMPLMSGLELLAEIKKDEKLKKILVYMLTTSSNDADVNKAYLHGAAGYLQKPFGSDDFQTMASTMRAAWSVFLYPTTV